MTAEEWLACDDLRLLLAQHRVTSNARKLRLFAVACCKRVEHLLYPESLALLTVAERFADGLASARELYLARDAAREMEKRFKYERGRHPQERQSAALAARLAGNENIPREARDIVCSCEAALRWEAGDWNSPWGEPLSDYLPLVREVYGNPYRSVPLPAHWRTPDVAALSRAAYEEAATPKGELDLVRLAILADALEEAGASGDLLEHLRSAGPHVRGCWALDLALGRG
jgi:hypothetical protein